MEEQSFGEVCSAVSDTAIKPSLVAEGYTPAPRWEADLDKLHFQEVLGSGGFGDVLKAIYTVTGEECAVKCLRVPGGRLEPMVHELRMMAMLAHPNIVEIRFASLVEDTVVCLVMPYALCLQDIIDEIKATKPYDQQHVISEESARLLIRQLLSGIAFLHQHRCVHRDLKCSNLLLTQRGVLKLTDFGLACRFDTECSEVGRLSTPTGTIHHMAPEVYLKSYQDEHPSMFRASQRASDEDAAPQYYDIRAETWGIAVVLLEMVLGRLPFDYLLRAGRVKDPAAELHRIMCTIRNSKTLDWDLLFPCGRTMERLVFSEEAEAFFDDCMAALPSCRPTCTQLLNHPWITADTENTRSARRRLRDELLCTSIVHAIQVQGALASQESMCEGEPLPAQLDFDQAVVGVVCKTDKRKWVVQFPVSLRAGFDSRLVENLAHRRLLPLARRKAVGGCDFVKLCGRVVETCALYEQQQHRTQLAYDLFVLSSHQSRELDPDTLQGGCVVFVTDSLPHARRLAEAEKPGALLRRYADELRLFGVNNERQEDEEEDDEHLVDNVFASPAPASTARPAEQTQKRRLSRLLSGSPVRKLKKRLSLLFEDDLDQLPAAPRTPSRRS